MVGILDKLEISLNSVILIIAKEKGYPTVTRLEGRESGDENFKNLLREKQ